MQQNGPSESQQPTSAMVTTTCDDNKKRSWSQLTMHGGILLFHKREAKKKNKKKNKKNFDWWSMWEKMLEKYFNDRSSCRYLWQKHTSSWLDKKSKQASAYASDLAAHNDEQEMNKTRLLSQSAKLWQHWRWGHSRLPLNQTAEGNNVQAWCHTYLVTNACYDSSKMGLCNWTLMSASCAKRSTRMVSS